MRARAHQEVGSGWAAAGGRALGVGARGAADVSRVVERPLVRVRIRLGLGPNPNPNPNPNPKQALQLPPAARSQLLRSAIGG